MSILRIYNVSDYVHAGAAPKTKTSFYKPPTYYAGVRELPDGSYSASRLPTGGIAFMLNPIFERITADDYEDETLVFCVDDTPTIKRKMYAEVLKDEMGYKATRAKKTLDVSIQRSAIKDILSLVSPNVLFAEGYEADDIIASLVKEYRNSYDHIYIHTRDTDLYCLVNDNVSIEPVGVQGKVVTKENFYSVMADKHNYPLPFNGVLLEKLFYGDRSDNIPGIGDYYINKVKSYITKDKYKYLVNLTAFKSWVSIATDNNPVVMGIVNLLLPLDVPSEYLTLYDEPINLNRLCYLGNKVQNKYCKKNIWNNGEEFLEVKEILDYYTDEYYMKGGRCNV